MRQLQVKIFFLTCFSTEKNNCWGDSTKISVPRDASSQTIRLCQTQNLFFTSNTTTRKNLPKSISGKKFNLVPRPCTPLLPPHGQLLSRKLGQKFLTQRHHSRLPLFAQMRSRHSGAVDVSFEQQRPHIGHCIHSAVVAVHLLSTIRILHCKCCSFAILARKNMAQ